MSNLSLKNYEKNRKYFLSLHTLPEEKLMKNTEHIKWSIREIIGHIYYWDKFLLDVMVPEMYEGAALPEFPDHDTYNEKSMKHIIKFTSTNELINEFALTRENLLQKIEAIPANTAFTIGKGKRAFSPNTFMAMFVEHDDHHIKQIEAFLKRQNKNSC
ncbi:DinB family protein [Bacillus haimaensis]|uniref:DinB family protein n=1 Tax=Bacillus haimaensis TaxID=3160967 RepID=UPI003AA98898